MLSAISFYRQNNADTGLFFNTISYILEKMLSLLTGAKFCSHHQFFCRSDKPRTFKIGRITIFIFSFCIGPVTQLNGPALGVLKRHYITKRIRELLIGNSRLLIYNLLNQLLYCTVWKKVAFSWLNLWKL